MYLLPIIKIYMYNIYNISLLLGGATCVQLLIYIYIYVFLNTYFYNYIYIYIYIYIYNSGGMKKNQLMKFVNKENIWQTDI